MGGGAGPTTWMAGQTYFAATGGAVSAEAKQQGAVQRLGLASRLQPAGLPQSDRTKIQLMMKSTNIKINSPVMRFSKTMMEMKRKKTAEEPKKQDAGARKRVALEEEDRVKLYRCTMFTKHPHVVYSPYHPFTV